MIEWAKKFALLEDVASTEKLAESVEDSGGVYSHYSVPAFDGLQVPFEKPTATDTICHLK